MKDEMMDDKHEVLQYDAIISTYTPLSDGALSIRHITTQEIESVDDLHKNWLRQTVRVYCVKGKAEPDIELHGPETVGRKSMSQRLRTAIAYLAIAKGIKKEDQEQFYRDRMAVFIADVQTETEDVVGLPKDTQE